MKPNSSISQNLQDADLQEASSCSSSVLQPVSCYRQLAAKIGLFVTGLAVGMLGLAIVSGCNGGALTEHSAVQDPATHAAWPEPPVEEASSGSAVSQTAGLQDTGSVWQENLPQALGRAAQDNKPVLLQFTASWCGPCRVMNSTVWPDEQVQAALAKHAVPVKIDIDEVANADVVQRYGVRSIPTILLVDANGDELARGGFMGAEALAQFIDRS